MTISSRKVRDKTPSSVRNAGTSRIRQNRSASKMPAILIRKAANDRRSRANTGRRKSAIRLDRRIPEITRSDPLREVEIVITRQLSLIFATRADEKCCFFATRHRKTCSTITSEGPFEMQVRHSLGDVHLPGSFVRTGLVRSG